MRRFLVTLSFIGMLGLANTSTAFAGGGVWLPGPADFLWDDPNNWEHGTPEIAPDGFGDSVLIPFNTAGPTNGPIIQSGIDAVAGTIILGEGGAWATNDPGGPTILTMTGGTLATTADFWIGRNEDQGPNPGSGAFEISDGTVTLGTSGHLVLGKGAEGTVTQTGGSITAHRLVLDWYGAADLQPSREASGIYNLNGGTLQVFPSDTAKPLFIGNQGLIDITDGIMELSNDQTDDLLALILTNKITAFGGAGTVLYDFNVTNPGLTTVWATSTPPADDADFDENTIVDGLDFLAWQRGFGILNPNAVHSDGDADFDLDVDSDDLAVWESQFGTTPLVGAIAAVPEPVSAFLFGVGGLMLVALRRCREQKHE